MTINVNPAAGKSLLNNAKPGEIADMLRAMRFGDVTRAQHTFLRGLVPQAAAVNPYVPAASQSVTLPDDAKGLTLVRAYARTGSGTVGPLTLDAPDSFVASTPSAGHVAISASGDLIFNAGDAWTSVDVIYSPDKYDIVELTLPVASNTLTLPTKYGLVAFIMEVEATTGTTVGKKIIDAPNNAPGAGHAALNAAKTAVAFNSSDAVTNARVKWAVASGLPGQGVDLNAFLENPPNDPTGSAANPRPLGYVG